MFSSDTSDRPSLDHGLTSQQVQLSRHHYSSNVLTPTQTNYWWLLYFDLDYRCLYCTGQPPLTPTNRNWY